MGKTDGDVGYKKESCRNWGFRQVALEVAVVGFREIKVAF